MCSLGSTRLHDDFSSLSARSSFQRQSGSHMVTNAVSQSEHCKSRGWRDALFSWGCHLASACLSISLFSILGGNGFGGPFHLETALMRCFAASRIKLNQLSGNSTRHKCTYLSYSYEILGEYRYLSDVTPSISKGFCCSRWSWTPTVHRVCMHGASSLRYYVYLGIHGTLVASVHRKCYMYVHTYMYIYVCRHVCLQCSQAGS